MTMTLEILRGRTASFEQFTFDQSDLRGDFRQAYSRVLVDIGTGDGRYVQHQAQADPTRLVIGVDACRDHLAATVRRAPANALFIIANAEALPPELNGCADQITVNFPWGSLLTGLLTPESAVLSSLGRLVRSRAAVEVYLNGGALDEQGWTLDDGAAQVRAALNRAGWRMQPGQTLNAAALKQFPTTWAKRLAFGRDPRAVRLHGIWTG